MDEIEGIDFIKSTYMLSKVQDMTSMEAYQTLAQAGFFIRGFKGLDMALLETLGINKPLGFGWLFFINSINWFT